MPNTIDSSTPKGNTEQSSAGATLVINFLICKDSAKIGELTTYLILASWRLLVGSRPESPELTQPSSVTIHSDELFASLKARAERVARTQLFDNTIVQVETYSPHELGPTLLPLERDELEKLSIGVKKLRLRPRLAETNPQSPAKPVLLFSLVKEEVKQGQYSYTLYHGEQYMIETSGQRTEDCRTKYFHSYALDLHFELEERIRIAKEKYAPQEIEVKIASLDLNTRRPLNQNELDEIQQMLEAPTH